MATTTYVSLQNLQRYDSNLKTYIDSNKTKAIKAIAIDGNEINFYCDPAPTTESTPDFTVNMPVEYFLDQAKTVLVQSFTWSIEIYPGSSDPNLEGKPVLVLAVKGDDNSVTYSFVNLESLVKIYEGKVTKSITITIDADTNKIAADINLSAEEGNILSIKEDGLYANVTEVDISTKADKLVDPEGGDPIIKAGQILVDNGAGNLGASAKTIEELTNEILNNFSAISSDDIDALFQ